MKRTILVLLLLAGLIVVPAMAQNFSSPRPQFLSFNVGVMGGYNLAVEEAIGASNFGINFMIIDNLELGIDRINTHDTISPVSHTLLRASFWFTDQFGAAVGVGSDISFGIFANFLQVRAANGLAYSLGFRADYVAPTDAFGDGSIFVGLRATFGL